MTATITKDLIPADLAGTLEPEEADSTAFREMIKSAPEAQVRFLLAAVGPRVTAAAVGMSDARPLRSWAAGQPIREAATKQKLALLFRMVYALTGVYGANAAALFLTSANPALSDHAPMLLLRQAEGEAVAAVEPQLLAAVRALA